MSAVCPCCGQPIMMRAGVRLSTRLRELYDAIERRPVGVRLDALAWIFYPGKDSGAAKNLIKQHVYRLNCALAETRVSIRARDGSYRIVRNGTRRAA